MYGLSRREVASWCILGVISLIAFAFTLSRLTMVPLPDGSAPLYFAGASKFLTGVRDVVSLHPFSVLVALFSSAFKLDVITSMKVLASLLAGLAPIALYLNAKFVSNSESVGVLTAFVGTFTFGFMSLVWGGEYHLVLGLTLFLAFAWLMGLCLRGGGGRVFWAFPLALILPLVDVVLALIAIAMSVVFAIYSFTMGRRSAVGYSVITTILTLVTLTLCTVSGEWRKIALMITAGEPLSQPFTASTWQAVPLALSFLGAVICLIHFYLKKGLDELVYGGFMLAVSLFTVFAFSQYTIPLLAALALLPLRLFREAYSVSKESSSEGEVIVINVEGEKFFAVLLAVLLVISLLNVGYGIAIEAPTAYISGQDLPALMRVLNWMTNNLTEQGLVAAPLSLAPLVEGYLGPRVLDWRHQVDALTAEAMAETCFRIVTPHLVVDEWEPLSPSRAPIISAYDGRRYVSLLYIDDSYAMVKLFRGDEAFFESPYGASFLDYNCSESDSVIELRVRFLTPNVVLWKSIRVSKLEPSITIIYNATLRSKAKIDAFNLPLWVAWGKGIARGEVSGSKVFLVVGGVEGYHSLEVKFKGASESPEIARSETGQEFIEGRFPAAGSSAKAEVEIKVNSSKPSQVKPVTLSLMDLPKTRHVTHMLVTNSSPALSIVGVRDYEVLYVVDSFVRFTFEYRGANYTEAPAYGTVINEAVSDGNLTRSVTYQTAGLIIHKNVTLSGNNLTLTYRAEGLKDGIELLNCSGFELWIPWERLLTSFSYEISRANLTLDAAKLGLSFQGKVAFFEVEPHPQYGQLRVYVAFDLDESSTVGVSIATDKELTAKYIETTRPEMKGSDVIRLYVKSGFFRELYSYGRFAVLEVLMP